MAVGDVLDGGGEEVGGGEDFEVALGFPVVAGTVDDVGGLFFPVDFLEREGGRAGGMRRVGARVTERRERVYKLCHVPCQHYFPAFPLWNQIYPLQTKKRGRGQEMFVIRKNLPKSIFCSGSEMNGIRCPQIGVGWRASVNAFHPVTNGLSDSNPSKPSGSSVVV
ncbi:MAG: hypothetical protein R3F19_23245 [Verrucomicrobiales bacterium]